MSSGSELRTTLLVGALSAVGCGHRAETADSLRVAASSASSQRKLPDCPPVTIQTTNWSTVTTKDGRLTLLVPQHSVAVPGRPDMWEIPTGSIAYWVSPLSRTFHDSLVSDSTAKEHGWCEKEISGAKALVQFVYAAPAMGKGYYLTATWPFSASEDAHLTGMVRDTNRAGVLLAIAQSAQRH
jgi:hypothetical protein